MTNVIDFSSYRDKMPRFSLEKKLCEVELLGEKPIIFLTSEVYETMYQIVDQSPKEVGWMGSVTRSGNNFLITQIHLFRQTVGPAHTHLDPESMGEFFAELAAQEDGVNKVNSVCFWGHSHCNFAARPSGNYDGSSDYGDLAQMFRFGQEGAEYMIMGIANKKGELYFEVFFYQQGIRVKDVECQILEQRSDEICYRVALELDEKVTVEPEPQKIGIDDIEEKEFAEFVTNEAFNGFVEDSFKEKITRPITRQVRKFRKQSHGYGGKNGTTD